MGSWGVGIFGEKEYGVGTCSHPDFSIGLLSVFEFEVLVPLIILFLLIGKDRSGVVTNIVRYAI